MKKIEYDEIVAQAHKDLIEQFEAAIYALKNYDCAIRKGDFNVVIEREPVSLGQLCAVSHFMPTGKRTFEIDMVIDFWQRDIK